MGIYWFNREILLQTLLKDEQKTLSSNDFGHDVLPLLIKDVSTHIIDIDSSHPWEDVGTIETYWNTHWKHQQTIQIWNILQTTPGSIFQTGYTSSPIPKSTQMDQCIIFENVVIGEHCTLKQVIIDTGCIVDNHITISLDTPIDGAIYKRSECLIIPKNSLVRYHEERQIVTVVPL